MFFVLVECNAGIWKSINLCISVQGSDAGFSSVGTQPAGRLSIAPSATSTSSLLAGSSSSEPSLLKDLICFGRVAPFATSYFCGALAPDGDGVPGRPARHCYI